MATRGFVSQFGTLVTAQHGTADKFDNIGAAVVIDALALAFNELVKQVAFFAVKRQLARGRHHNGPLVTLGVLLHINPVTPNDGGAFGDDHIAGKDTGLLQVVITQSIGLCIHGLVAISVFCRDWQHGQRNDRGDSHH